MRKVLFLVLLAESTQQGGRCYRAEFYYFVKTVLLILVEGFTGILLFVGFFPSRSYCLAFDWGIIAGKDTERLGIGIAVLPWP